MLKQHIGQMSLPGVAKEKEQKYASKPYRAVIRRDAFTRHLPRCATEAEATYRLLLEIQRHSCVILA